MNAVSGRVVLGNTGAGLPDLLVVVYDVDPDTTPEEGLPSDQELTIQPWPPSLGDRIGSTLTAADGSFELTYEDTEFQIRHGETERRPDLLVFVQAYEQESSPTGGAVVFGPSRVRHNAGRIEQFIIRISEDVLIKSGVPLPGATATDPVSPKRVVADIEEGVDRAAKVYLGRQTAERQRVTAARTTLEPFHAELATAIRTQLSPRPNGAAPSRFVGAGESVADKTADAIREDIETVVNQDGRSVRQLVALTKDQRDEVEAKIAADGTISGEDVDAIVGGPDARTSLHREDPLARFAQSPSRLSELAAQALGVDGAAEPPDEEDDDIAGPGVETDESIEVKSYVARLVETMTSPEEQVLTGLEPRADREGVADAISALAFAPSPADTPAFYDFHQLQIAFRHTWQEAIDEGVLELAEDAYRQIVELGGSPPGVIADPIRGLRNEARLVLAARAAVVEAAPAPAPAPTPGVPPPARNQPPSSRVRDHRRSPTVRDHRGSGVTVVPPGLDPRAVDDPATKLPEILAELEQRLRGQHAFTIYAANRKERSVNFALLTQYTQRWEPLAYQAGKLAKTITLAPKETRRFSKKLVTHKKRAEKEVQNQVRAERDERSSVTRAEEDIVRKASVKTNFALTSKGTMEIPLGGSSIGGETTSSFSREAARSSEATKKAFHEAVFKAARDYKSEHSVEVTTEQVEDLEVVEAGDITNPNDGSAVAFLFYELQRRYRVTERLNRLTPVVLVAQEVPRPDEIDEAWLIAHDWILRRVLLDDSFRPALDLVTQNIVGEQVALQEMRTNMQQQRAIVAELRQELTIVRRRMDAYRNLGERSLLGRGTARGGGDDGGWLSNVPIVGDAVEAFEEGLDSFVEEVGSFLFGGGETEPGTSRADALKEAIDRTAEDERDALFRLDREVTALNALTESYTKAVTEYLNHRAQVARLRTHVVDNVLYYMQAIWAHEPEDQRFFRLHETPIPTLRATKRTYRFADLTPKRSSLAAVAHRRLEVDGRPPRDLYECDVSVTVDPGFETAPLAEVADLDTLLGFKGNYMIFPLRESNALTDYMMAPYVVAGLEELIDPDDLGNVSLDEFAQYVISLEERLSADDFKALRPQLTEQYRRLLADPRRNGDVVTIPTDSLFIEALPAATSLLETYKTLHRAIDVKKVQAEVRKLELENLRHAARLLDEQLDDPDIDRQIRIEGANGPVVVDPNP